ncbi:MAG: hypothetical protein IJI25_05275 [Eubacterium sp.]|nr:hypothetical protein [Eubacterium sp.]
MSEKKEKMESSGICSRNESGRIEPDPGDGNGKFFKNVRKSEIIVSTFLYPE